MSAHFLDTSALVKHYRTEIGSPKVDALWGTPGAQLLISRLGVLEAVSAFARFVPTGGLAPQDFLLLRGRFLADIRLRKPSVVALLPSHYREADRLIQRHGLVRGVRTLDALQLAVALGLHRQGLLTEVVTADQVLFDITHLEGIPVSNPEAP